MPPSRSVDSAVCRSGGPPPGEDLLLPAVKIRTAKWDMRRTRFQNPKTMEPDEHCKATPGSWILSCFEQARSSWSGAGRVRTFSDLFRQCPRGTNAREVPGASVPRETAFPSETQRHHHVARLLAAGLTHQRRGVGVAQLDDHFLVAQGGEGIQQVVHIEADGQIADRGVGLDLFLGFFLFRLCALIFRLPGETSTRMPRYSRWTGSQRAAARHAVLHDQPSLRGRRRSGSPLRSPGNGHRSASK